MQNTHITSFRGVDGVRVFGDEGPIEGLPIVVVTGSRRATPYGHALADAAGQAVAAAGLCLLTTAAPGASATAARAFSDAGGVMAVASYCGADVVWPHSSSDVFASARCVISLERDGTPAVALATKRRDQLLAAVADALIVCEAGVPSGIFSLAEAFSFAGKPVLAFPGSVLSTSCAGTNALLEQGVATPLMSVSALHRALSDLFPETQAACDPLSRAVLAVLTRRPQNVSTLRHALGISVRDAASALASLEANGLVERLPDATYAPKSQRRHVFATR